ncbi:GTPase [Nonomuraea phyllanthi]|uniref:GTPase n=1 Tax=Nonomuraea phyllanthi TaxID=2219224 RepID=UPI001D01987D|nr:GTPase [Nonomuraea phyllanthi]
MKLLRRKEGPSLDIRLAALLEAASLAEGRLSEEAVSSARAVAERAGARRTLSLDHTVAALAGATGSGKSSLYNALAGTDLAAVGVVRPTTAAAQAALWDGDGAGPLLDWLDIPQRHSATPVSDLSGLVLLDLPDHDSIRLSHRLEVDRLVEMVDLLVWVVDPQKYADAALHERYLRPLAAHRGVMLVVLNQADRLPGPAVDRCLADLRRLLDEDGLTDVPALAVSARTGSGLGRLRELLGDRVARRKSWSVRLTADIATAAAQLATAGPPSPQAPLPAERAARPAQAGGPGERTLDGSPPPPEGPSVSGGGPQAAAGPPARGKAPGAPATGDATPGVPAAGDAAPGAPAAGGATSGVSAAGGAAPGVPAAGGATSGVSAAGGAAPRVPAAGGATPGVPAAGRATPGVLAGGRASSARGQAAVEPSGAGKAAPGALAGERVPGMERALTAALSEAAGVPLVVAAVAKGHRHRAVVATGWPVTRWVRKLRPDPLRRLRIGIAAPVSGPGEARRARAAATGRHGEPPGLPPAGRPGEQPGAPATGRVDAGAGAARGHAGQVPRIEIVGRTSVPAASAVQKAKVDTAIRDVGETAAEGLPGPWAVAVRQAARSRSQELADQVDRAVATTSARATRSPRWWGMVNGLQWLVFAVMLAGALWLGVLFAMDYLRLPQPPLPTVGEVPWPTVLLAGGALLGVLIALLSRLAAWAGGRRRARRTARALRAAIGQVSDDLVLAPVRAELDRYARFTELLALARDRR